MLRPDINFYPEMALSLSTTCVFRARPNTSPTIFTRFNISPTINLSRSSLLFATFSGRRICPCRALSSGRPPPPESEPPNGKDSGPASTIARLQETTGIFFAVLFWMALFFWYSAWDERNNDGGTLTRPRRGSWFRR